MKQNIFFVLMTLFLNFSYVEAQVKDPKPSITNEALSTNLKEESFRVYGNCGMCEKTIEGSLKNVKGVILGDWNKETKIMKVKYNPQIITLGQIKQKIADVGYDSDTHRAKDSVYHALHACCQYDRPEKIKE